jgi:CBS domain-containing protein
MICPACHAENIEGSDECHECGQALYGLDLPGASYGAKGLPFIQEHASTLPKRPVITVGSDDPVGLAVRKMQRQEQNALLVMDDDNVSGIITGWDILQKVAGAAVDLNAVTCAQVMTRSPFMLHDDDTIATVLNVMASSGFGHVPIADGDQHPTGLIVINDVFRHISPHLV